jgi:hypothetical protein
MMNFQAANLIAVTPDDANDLPNGPSAAIYVGTAGDLKVLTTRSAAAVTLKNLPVGWHLIPAQKIWATGTTAAQIVAVYVV